MTEDQIRERLTRIIRDVLDDETIVISRETTANDVADWDSLAHINIIVAIEKEFDIRFGLEELKPLKDVGELLDAIERKLPVDVTAVADSRQQLHELA